MCSWKFWTEVWKPSCFPQKAECWRCTGKTGCSQWIFPPVCLFPAIVHPALEDALGIKVLETHRSPYLLACAESETAVREACPDIAGLKTAVSEPVIITAGGTDCDFVSRFFAPNVGIDEDPVTGSAHTTLIPFWSRRLGKAELTARQLSKRGGTLFCRDCGERVEIGGRAKLYLTGEIHV